MVGYEPPLLVLTIRRHLREIPYVLIVAYLQKLTRSQISNFDVAFDWIVSLAESFQIKRRENFTCLLQLLLIIIEDLNVFEGLGFLEGEGSRYGHGDYDQRYQKLPEEHRQDGEQAAEVRPRKDITVAHSREGDDHVPVRVPCVLIRLSQQEWSKLIFCYSSNTWIA